MTKSLAQNAVIAGDIFRANQDLSFGQAENVRWADCILRESMRHCFGAINTYDAQLGSLDYKEFYSIIYKESGRDFFEQLAEVYSYGVESSFFESTILPQFVNKFVILFEGSPWLMERLDNFGISYCNLRVHPARFGKDLILSLYFNDPDVMQRARQYCLHPDFLTADIAYARSIYRSRHATNRTNSLIFLSQTSYDSMLIEAGRFLSVQRYRDDVRNLGHGRELYIKPHPYDARSRVFKEFIEIFPDAKIEETNTYELFCTATDTVFVTLSSGSGHEAELFGHKVQYLSSRNMGLGSQFQNEYVHLSHAFWAPTFWRFVLRGEGAPTLRHPFVADRVRNSLGVKWAKEF